MGRPEPSQPDKPYRCDQRCNAWDGRDTCPSSARRRCRMTSKTELAGLLAKLAQALAEHEEPVKEPAAARPMPERVLLTVDEAAERLGIGRTLTFRLVKIGDIESVTIGRLRR